MINFDTFQKQAAILIFYAEMCHNWIILKAVKILALSLERDWKSIKRTIDAKLLLTTTIFVNVNKSFIMPIEMWSLLF